MRHKRIPSLERKLDKSVIESRDVGEIMTHFNSHVYYGNFKEIVTGTPILG